MILFDKNYQLTAKNFLHLFLPTIVADTEKIQPMIQNLKLRFRSDLLCHLIQAFQVRVDNFLAPDTDNVRVGIRPVAIIAVAPIGKPQLQNFAKLLD
jgi:hypothetical protein